MILHFTAKLAKLDEKVTLILNSALNNQALVFRDMEILV